MNGDTYHDIAALHDGRKNWGCINMFKKTWRYFFGERGEKRVLNWKLRTFHALQYLYFYFLGVHAPSDNIWLRILCLILLGLVTIESTLDINRRKATPKQKLFMYVLLAILVALVGTVSLWGREIIAKI